MSQPAFTEHALRFDCEGEQLLGILALPGRDASSTAAHTAMLMVVGGPQYRAGSHRQFTLSARAAAAAGMPVLRFDYRGMGDSSGALRQFEGVEHDIAAAIDALQRRCPSVRSVVLYGLCDAASASLLYWDATRDPRIAAMCLLNPWVRSDAGLARVHVTHYYKQRLRDPAFWRKLLHGEVARDALGGALRSVSQASVMRAARAPGISFGYPEPVNPEKPIEAPGWMRAAASAALMTLAANAGFAMRADIAPPVEKPTAKRLSVWIWLVIRGSVPG